MPLPATIVQDANVVWSDHRLSVAGPFAASPLDPLAEVLVPNGVFVAFGTGTGNEYAGQTLTLVDDAVATAADVPLSKVGSAHADDVTVQLLDATLSVVATGTVLPADIPLNRYVRATFAAPVALTAAAGPYTVALHRSGASDATNYYQWLHSTANPYAGGVERTRAYGSSTWVDVPANDLGVRLVGDVAVPSLFVVAHGRTGPSVSSDTAWIAAYRSRDNGHTWAEVDVAGRPVSYPIIRAFTGADASASAFAVSHAGTSGVATTHEFDMATCTWARVGAGPPFNTTTNVSNQMPFALVHRASGTVGDVAITQGLAETVMSTAYRRAKVVYPTSPVAYTTVDLHSGTTANPGTQVHYDARVLLKGEADRAHVFWTGSDANTLRSRTLDNANTLSAVVTVAGVAPSATAAYPIGVPCTYVLGGVTRIAVPVVDGSTTKVCSCESAGAGTAANWSVQTALASASEVTASDPCAVFPDLGARLYVLRVDASTRGLSLTNDRVGGNWVAPEPWRGPTAAQPTVAGVSMRVLGDRVGVVYYDASVTPSALRYDHVRVPFPKQSYAVGTYTAQVDFGGEGEAGPVLAIDSDAGAGGVAVVTVGEAVCSAEGAAEGYGTAVLGYPAGVVDATLEVTGAAMVVGVTIQ